MATIPNESTPRQMDLGIVTLPSRYFAFPRGLPRDYDGPRQDPPVDFALGLGRRDDEVQIARADDAYDGPFREVRVRRRRDGHDVPDPVTQRDTAEAAARDPFDHPRVPTDVRAHGVARRTSAPREIAEVDVDEDGGGRRGDAEDELRRRTEEPAARTGPRARGPFALRRHEETAERVPDDE